MLRISTTKPAPLTHGPILRRLNNILTANSFSAPVRRTRSACHLAARKISAICVAPGMRQSGSASKTSSRLEIETAYRHASSGKRRSPIIGSKGNVGSPTTTTSISPFLRNDRYPAAPQFPSPIPCAREPWAASCASTDVCTASPTMHVAAGLGLPHPGMPISGPGLLDVGPGALDPSVIGYHAACSSWRPGIPDNVSITENLDLAIFRIKTEDAVTSFRSALRHARHLRIGPNHHGDA